MLIRNIYSEDTIKELAQLYRDGDNFEPTPRQRGQLRHFVVRTFYAEKYEYWGDVRVVFVKGQPYENADEMRQDMVDNEVLRISTDYNESDLWGEAMNLLFRATHDMQHAREAECGFFFDGEVCAYTKFAAYTEDVLFRQILFSEIVLQVAYLRVYGDYIDTQKTVLVDYDKYIRPVLERYNVYTA